MSVEITFRTLKGASFKLVAPPAETVLELKKKVGERQNVDDYAGFRLIYKGKILRDDATVESAAISSAGFVVVMPPKKVHPKPKPEAPKPKQEAPKPEPEKKDAEEEKPAPAEKAAPAPEGQSSTAPPPASASAAPASAPATASAPAPAAASSEPAVDATNSLVTGAEYEASVRQICEMGFPEAKVKKALRAAFNNPQRAVDYLFTGIPETAAPPAPPAVPRSAAAATANDTAANAAPPAGNSDRAPASAAPFNMFEAQPGGGAAAQGTAGNLDFLRGHPQFNMMRRLIQASPSVLPQLLQQLEVQNPSLLAMIDANQVEFTRLINEPLREGELGGDEALEQAAQAMAGVAGLGGQPGPDQVMVSEEEHQQIIRLSELGASIGLEESDVVETWLACNRDEDLAANYLVDHAEELRADSQRNAQNSSNPSNGPGTGDGGPPS